MNELRIFNNPELGQVRMVMIDDKPYFVGNDVARILEYSRPNDAITANCKGGGHIPYPYSGRYAERKSDTGRRYV